MGVSWAISSDSVDIIASVSGVCVCFFLLSQIKVVMVALMSMVRVLTYAIIYLDFIAKPHIRLDTIHDTMCTSFLKWDVETESVRLIRTYEKYHEHNFTHAFSFFFLSRSYFCTRFCSDVKHFNAQFTTINTLKSYRFALWLRSMTTESEEMKKNSIVISSWQ